MDILFLFIILIIMVTFRVPIGFAIAGATMLTMVTFTDSNLTVVAQYCVTGVNSFSIMAIPFFILAGSIMSFGGIARRIVDASMALVGHLAGGLGAVVTLASMFFAALSGSGMATTAAMGGAMIPEMVKKGYERGYAAAITASAGTMGPIIPPSLMFVIYGCCTNTSISDLFTAGIIPGILMGVGLLIANSVICQKSGVPKAKKASGQMRLRAIWDAKWALLAPVIILGGIYSGIFTPTESAVVACVYCAVVSIFIYREISPKQLYASVLDTVAVNGMTTFLLGTCTAFAAYLSLANVPAKLLAFITGITDSKIVFLLLVNVLLLIVGMFLDSTPATMILAPILLPVVESYGMSAIHFGIVMCLNLAIGLVTPPYGCNLFVASAVAELPMEKMVRPLLPLICVLIIVLMVVTYIPGVSMLLVK